jgi:aminoglycoside phosphotransferase
VAQPLIKLAGPPRNATVPTSVATVAGGKPLRAVWENELGGLTFEVGSGAGRCFVKWAPTSSGIDLDAEAARLLWAQKYSPVPRLLDRGRDETGGWIVTSPMAGESAVAERWKADPARAVDAVGTGLRALHDAVPVAECPFSWSRHDRVDVARHRAALGQLESERWHPVHRSLTVEMALGVLDDSPDVDKLVVCHGDACAPNTMLTDDGNWSGHTDLGALGVADRWADLAVATWSTQWNYGPGWEDRLLAAYGIAADRERTRYYRLLWDLGP